MISEKGLLNSNQSQFSVASVIGYSQAIIWLWVSLKGVFQKWNLCDVILLTAILIFLWIGEIHPYALLHW